MDNYLKEVNKFGEKQYVDRRIARGEAPPLAPPHQGGPKSPRQEGVSRGFKGGELPPLPVHVELREKGGVTPPLNSKVLSGKAEPNLALATDQEPEAPQEIVPASTWVEVCQETYQDDKPTRLKLEQHALTELGGLREEHHQQHFGNLVSTGWEPAPIQYPAFGHQRVAYNAAALLGLRKTYGNWEVWEEGEWLLANNDYVRGMLAGWAKALGLMAHLSQPDQSRKLANKQMRDLDSLPWQGKQLASPIDQWARKYLSASQADASVTTDELYQLYKLTQSGKELSKIGFARAINKSVRFLFDGQDTTVRYVDQLEWSTLQPKGFDHGCGRSRGWLGLKIGTLTERQLHELAEIYGLQVGRKNKARFVAGAPYLETKERRG